MGWRALTALSSAVIFIATPGGAPSKLCNFYKTFSTVQRTHCRHVARNKFIAFYFEENDKSRELSSTSPTNKNDFSIMMDMQKAVKACLWLLVRPNF